MAAPEEALGGLLLNQSVTVKCFLFMLDILLAPSDAYCVSLRGSNVVLSASDQRLQPGGYDIIPITPEGKIVVTDEPCILRVYSRTSTRKLETFRSQVRARDGKCVITGVVNPQAQWDLWTGFQAAHVFPLSHGTLFRQSGLSEFITNRTGEEDSGTNSCQNGLLMQPTIHQLFDSFDISINADDNYKVVCFRPDAFGVDGRILDPVCRNPHDERSVRDELLRWHFRQAVLANMRGAGEPYFEMDFPPGTDMVGEILSGPQPAERMETEFFLRLEDVK
ncbi:HNH endonuclease-domain-containing protein [Lipomyces kononenkoae]